MATILVAEQCNEMPVGDEKLAPGAKQVIKNLLVQVSILGHADVAQPTQIEWAAYSLDQKRQIAAALRGDSICS